MKKLSWTFVLCLILISFPAFSASQQSFRNPAATRQSEFPSHHIKRASTRVWANSAALTSFFGGGGVAWSNIGDITSSSASLGSGASRIVSSSDSPSSAFELTNWQLYQFLPCDATITSISIDVASYSTDNQTWEYGMVLSNSAFFANGATAPNTPVKPSGFGNGAPNTLGSSLSTNVTLFTTNIQSTDPTWGFASPAGTTYLRNMLAHNDVKLDLQLDKLNATGDGSTYSVSWVALDIEYDTGGVVFCGTGNTDTSQFCCDCSSVSCGPGGNIISDQSCACDCSGVVCTSPGYVQSGVPCSCNCDAVSCGSGVVKPQDCSCDCSSVNCNGGTLSGGSTCACDCSAVNCGSGTKNDDCTCNCQAVNCNSGTYNANCGCVCPLSLDCGPGNPKSDCTCDCSGVPCGTNVNPADCSCSCLKCTPPALVQAIFGDSGSSITVTFDSATDRAVTDCTVLNGMTLQLFPEALCYWNSPTEFVILPTRASTVAPGDTLVLRANTLRASGAWPIDPTASGSIVISPPSNPVPPVAQLSLIGGNLCDPIILDAGNSILLSQDGAGLALSFSWVLVSPSGAPAALKTYIQNTVGTMLYLQPSMLQLGVSYVIRVTVTNYVSQQDSAQQTVLLDARPVPTVLINGDQNPTLLITRGQAIEGTGTAAACFGSNNAINFLWSISPAIASPGLINYDQDIVFIPAGSLAGGQTYTLTLTGTMAADNTVFASSSITINAAFPPLEAFFAQGNGQVTLSLLSTVNFSIETVTGTGSNQPITYSWSCIGSSACASVGNTPFFSLSALSLGLGSFTLNAVVTQGSQVINLSVFITTVAAAVPTVSVMAPPRADPALRIRLQGAAVSSTNSNIAYQWSAPVAHPGFVLDSTTLASDPQQANLVLLPDALIQGFTYTFRLTATDINGAGSASVMVTTFRPPFGGTMSVTPSAGIGGNTTFTISLDGWRDDIDSAADLLYQYGYLDIDGSWVILASTSDTSVPTMLPLLDWTNSITLCGKVTDRDGTATRAQTTVIVNPPPPAQVVEVITNAIDSIQSSTNYQQATATIVVAATLTQNSGLPPETQTSLMTQVVSQLVNVIQSIPPTSEAVEQATSVLVVLSNNTDVLTDTTRFNLLTTAQTASQVMSSLDKITAAVAANSVKLWSNLLKFFAPSGGGSRRRQLTDNDYNNNVQVVHGERGVEVRLYSANASASFASEADARAALELSFGNVLQSAVVNISIPGLSDKVCGEIPTKIETDNIQLVLSKGCCNLSASEVDVGNESNSGAASFDIPASAENLTGCPDAFVSSYSFSPWADPSNSLISGVYSFSAADGGSVIELQDLPDRLIIKIDIPKNSVPYGSLDSDRVKCSYVDPLNTAAPWQQNGCGLVSVSETASTFEVICACNHATDFGVVYNQDAGGDGLSPGAQAGIAVAVVVAFCFVVAVVLVVLALVFYKKKLRYRLHRMEEEEDETRNTVSF